jgi:hypothetical protein
MFFHSQIQQFKQLRQHNKAERRAALKQIVTGLVQGAMCGMVMLAPAFAVAFGWVKD